MLSMIISCYFVHHLGKYKIKYPPLCDRGEKKKNLKIGKLSKVDFQVDKLIVTTIFLVASNPVLFSLHD